MTRCPEGRGFGGCVLTSYVAFSKFTPRKPKMKIAQVQDQSVLELPTMTKIGTVYFSEENRTQSLFNTTITVLSTSFTKTRHAKKQKNMACMQET